MAKRAPAQPPVAPRGRMVPKYPNAQDKINHYQKAADDLKDKKRDINKALPGYPGYSFTDGSGQVTGDYYAAYLTSKNEWQDEFLDIRKAFAITFMNDVDACILKAEAKVVEWTNKKNEEVYDPNG